MAIKGLDLNLKEKIIEIKYYHYGQIETDDFCNDLYEAICFLLNGLDNNFLYPVSIKTENNFYDKKIIVDKWYHENWD